MTRAIHLTIALACVIIYTYAASLLILAASSYAYEDHSIHIERTNNALKCQQYYDNNHSEAWQQCMGVQRR
jgi:hypothetical protein